MRITNHIHALKIPFQIPVGPGINIERFAYVYFICGKELYLIDTAVASAKDHIFNYIHELGRKPEDIKTVFLTHTHPDHIGTVSMIKEISGCSVAVHSAEKEWIEDIDKQFQIRPVPGFYSLVSGSVTVDKILKDQDVIELEPDLNLHVYHTPGHSKGSVSFYLREDKALFSGDLVPVNGDIPIYEDMNTLCNSIEKTKRIEDVDILLSSWTDPFKGDQIGIALQSGLDYIEKIDRAVKEHAADFSEEPMSACKKVLQTLRLPLHVANPLVLNSFKSHLTGEVDE